MHHRLKKYAIIWLIIAIPLLIWAMGISKFNKPVPEVQSKYEELTNKRAGIEMKIKRIKEEISTDREIEEIYRLLADHFKKVSDSKEKTLITYRAERELIQEEINKYINTNIASKYFEAPRAHADTPNETQRLQMEFDYYLTKNYPESPLIGQKTIENCKKYLTPHECKIALSIIKHESKYGTAFASTTITRKEAKQIAQSELFNPAGLKCNGAQKKETNEGVRDWNCYYPDDNGMYLSKYKSWNEFLDYFFRFTIGTLYEGCHDVICFSTWYVGARGQRSSTWEASVEKEIQALSFINY